MPKYVLTESTLHYATGFLARYVDKYPSRIHADALKELRDVSNLLLENLEQSAKLEITRHDLRR